MPNRLAALARKRTEELTETNRENMRLKASLNMYVILIKDIVEDLESGKSQPLEVAGNIRLRLGQMAAFHRIPKLDDPPNMKA